MLLCRDVPAIYYRRELFDSSKRSAYIDFGRQKMTIQLSPPNDQCEASRQEAVRRMEEFGDKYHPSLGEPITRKLLHEGHRY